MFGKILSLLILLAFHCNCQGVSFRKSSDIVWTRDIILGNAFNVKWSNDDSEWLVMEISAPTQGYVSVGFSPNGQMRGSDIFMGWVDAAGVPQFKDLYAIGNSVPLEDDTNDYELLSAKQTDSGTTIRFRRPWNTCDTKHDMEITEDTVRLIWAYGEYDPPPTTFDNAFQPEVHDYRGVRSVFLKVPTHLFQFPDDKILPDNRVKYWDVKMDRVQIPREDTVYYCKIFKVPETERKHQIIGFREIIDESNKQNVHHMNFFECTVPPAHGSSADVFEQYLRHPAGFCYTKNMPPEWGQYCMTVPFVWVAGAEGLMLPNDVGIPLGEQNNGTTYFMLEIHYDNPKLRQFEDSSGVRLFITDNVRKNDAGTVTMHARFGQFQMIPPRAKDFKNMAFCSEECTQQTIPPEGITVTHATLHAHLAAKEMRLRHIRNGVELEPIAQDLHFDFNFQQSRLVDPPRKVLPGDIVLVECDYDTSERDRITYGGTSTRDEMCQGYITYYPRINLTLCKTAHEFNNFFNALGIHKVEGQRALDKVQLPYKPSDTDIYDPGDDAYILKNYLHDGKAAHLFELLNVTDPDYGRSTTVSEYVNSLKWSEDDGKLTKEVAKQWWEGDHYSLCTDASFTRVPLKNYIVRYPKYRPYVKQVEDKCQRHYLSVRKPYTSGITSLSFGGLPILSTLVLSYALFL